MWIGATVEGPFARVHPGIVTVAPASVERVTVIVEPAGINRENHASGGFRPGVARAAAVGSRACRAGRRARCHARRAAAAQALFLSTRRLRRDRPGGRPELSSLRAAAAVV